MKTEKKMKCEFKRSISKSLPPIWRYWSSEDVPMRGSPIMVYGGAFGDVFIKHVLGSAIKKGGPLEEIKIVII